MYKILFVCTIWQNNMKMMKNEKYEKKTYNKA